jgi:SpoVK/Ycf46/Vps4 family AAA+-type ATPase
MFIGDGAKLVRDCFALAKEKAPSIIFIDELDAVGTKRFDSEKSGDREVQRTMLELLNQLDGFASDERIKVLAATNRVDVLDPALLRSGRLDRKIEFPLPNEESRAQILRIHSRKMTIDEGNINWNELARSTDEFGIYPFPSLAGTMLTRKQVVQCLRQSAWKLVRTLSPVPDCEPLLTRDPRHDCSPQGTFEGNSRALCRRYRRSAGEEERHVRLPSP